MGANESRPGGGPRPFNSNRTANENDQNSTSATEDLYEILQVNTDATTEEIKKAFRKQALIHHPDKNYENVEQATKRFAQIQQAYEILSDDDERAFYDRHRDELLNANDEGLDNFDPTQLKPNKPRSSMNPGITTKQLLKFFDTSLWKADFSDSPGSFYTIYRNLFDQLSLEEKVARNDTTIIYPSFGTSQSSYDQDIDGSRAVRHFYTTWANFGTQKSFEWVEAHHVSHQTDRRIKRLVEKENQRVRETARREYNETVRSLVSFVKKRDPRFATSAASNPDKWRAQEIQRIKRELRDVAERRAKEREDEAREFREQAWQRQQAEQSVSAQQEAADDSSTVEETSQDEELEAVNDWYCAACGKDFNSQGAWDNHERSKKHRQNAHRLRKQMIKEDAELSLSTSMSPASSSTTPFVSQTPDTQEDDHETSDAELESQIDVEDTLESLRLENSNPNPLNEVPSDSLSDTAESQPPELLDPADSSHSLTNSELLSQKTNAIKEEEGSSESEIEAIGMVRKRGKKVRRPMGGRAADLGTDGEGDASTALPSTSDEPVALKNELSKREKRRAKEAAKKLEGQKSSPSNTSKADANIQLLVFTDRAISKSCNVCHASFASKTKLFEHIKSTGHAAAQRQPTSNPGPSGKASKKKGRR